MRFLKRAALAVLTLVLAAPLQAQPSGGFCSSTGFNLNLGVNTKSWRCGLGQLVAGAGTLTLNNTTTITVASGSFVNIVPPEAVPGADNVTFKTSGLVIVFGSQTYYLQIVTKVSDTNLTVNLAGANPGLTGTVTRWSYWNTTCRRSSLTSITWDAATSSAGPLWTSHSALRSGDTSTNNGTVNGVCFSQGVSTPSSLQYFLRPQGLNAPLTNNTVDFTNGSCPTVALTARSGTPSSVSLRGQEFQMSVASTVGNDWPVSCIYVHTRTP